MCKYDYLCRTVDAQNEIIRKQSSIINELFHLVAEDTPLETLDPIINAMNSVSQLEYDLNS